jgi:hypothetical protein
MWLTTHPTPEHRLVEKTMNACRHHQHEGTYQIHTGIRTYTIRRLTHCVLRRCAGNTCGQTTRTLRKHTMPLPKCAKSWGISIPGTSMSVSSIPARVPLSPLICFFELRTRSERAFVGFWRQGSLLDVVGGRRFMGQESTKHVSSCVRKGTITDSCAEYDDVTCTAACKHTLNSCVLHIEDPQTVAPQACVWQICE